MFAGRANRLSEMSLFLVESSGCDPNCHSYDRTPEYLGANSLTLSVNRPSGLQLPVLIGGQEVGAKKLEKRDILGRSRFRYLGSGCEWGSNSLWVVVYNSRSSAKSSGVL